MAVSTRETHERVTPALAPAPLPLLAAAWSIAVAIPDLVVRRVGAGHLDAGRLGFLILGFGASFVLWLLVAIGLSHLRARRGWGRFGFVALLALFVAVVPFFVLAVERYQLILGVEIPASAAAFMLRNPRYALALMREAMGKAEISALASAQLVLLVVLVRATRTRLALPMVGRPARASIAFASALPLVALSFPRLPLPPDLHGVRTLVGGVWVRATSGSKLPSSTHRPPLPTFARRTPNVLFLLHESLAAEQWSPWNPIDGAPAVAEFLERHRDRAVWFPDATPAAACTDVSLPSIFTGLDADAPRESYAAAPLLWQEARAAGSRTQLVSAQDFEWAHFREFFLDAGAPDDVKTARDFAAPRVCDDGVDDRIAVEEAIARITKKAETRDATPFFMVVHFNATHGPCWVPPGEPGAELGGGFGGVAAMRPRCLASAAFVARQTARLLETLERAALLDDTLVVGTADHGETFRDGRPTRVENYYEDVLHVPLYVVVPARLAQEDPGAIAAARQNREVRVGNVDLYPTILDAYGRWPLPADAARPALAGTSLLRPIARDRTLAVSNTNDIRVWSRDGYALYHGRWKWRIDEQEGAKLFDLAADPAEKNDLAPEAPAAELAWLRAEADRRANLRRVLLKTAPTLLD